MHRVLSYLYISSYAVAHHFGLTTFKALKTQNRKTRKANRTKDRSGVEYHGRSGVEEWNIMEGVEWSGTSRKESGKDP